QVVVALPRYRGAQPLELAQLIAQATRIVGGRVRPVQTDLGPRVEQGFDEPRAEAFVHLGRRAVVWVVMSTEDEARRAGGTTRAGLRDDLLEPPVWIGLACAMQRREREPGRFAQRVARATGEQAPLQSRCRTEKTDRR